MNEYGYVEDIELAKAIQTMYFGSKFITEKELLEQIKSSLFWRPLWYEWLYNTNFRKLAKRKP